MKTIHVHVKTLNFIHTEYFFLESNINTSVQYVPEMWKITSQTSTKSLLFIINTCMSNRSPKLSSINEPTCRHTHVPCRVLLVSLYLCYSKSTLHNTTTLTPARRPIFLRCFIKFLFQDHIYSLIWW